MTISERSDEVRVQAYFQCLAASDLERPQYEWAFDEIWELTVSDPERAWPLAVLIIQRTPEDFRLMASAAGWLQNILAHHGPKFIDRVEALSRSDPHFRKFLFMLNSRAVPAEIFTRVLKTLDGDTYSPPL
jgi:hypothetical protein